MTIEQLKENIAKMSAQNAPMEDTDGYIKAIPLFCPIGLNI